MGTISFAVSSVMFVGIFFQPCRLHVHAPKNCKCQSENKENENEKENPIFPSY